MLLRRPARQGSEEVLDKIWGMRSEEWFQESECARVCVRACVCLWKWKGQTPCNRFIR